MSIPAWRGGGRVRGRGSGLIEGAHKPRPDLESICEALLRPSSQPTTSSRSFWPGKCQTCTLEACVLIRGRPCRWRSRLRSLGQSRCAGALLGTYMRDTGGKSGRRPGRHLQVEASGPGYAASVTLSEAESAFGSRGNRNKNTCSLSQPFPHRSAITSRCRKTRTG